MEMWAAIDHESILSVQKVFANGKSEIALLNRDRDDYRV
jgi:hypothetical protein